MRKCKKVKKMKADGGYEAWQKSLKKPGTVKLKAWAYKVEGKYTSAGKYKTHSTDIPCHILIKGH